ncbi:CapA family protein [Oerskovia turbata]
MSVAENPPKTRLAWADSARGLLIILVVFWHVVIKTYLEIDWRLDVPISGAWGALADLSYPVRMPLFFLISGVFAAGAIARPWAEVFRRRVVRFLYLYLLWTLIHMATMWAFPDFPTLIPRTLAEFVDAITISPPNTWFLYALALYFVVAKAFRRLPRWIPLAGASALTIAVGAGLIDIVSNRGSLLANLLYFLLGAYFSTHVIRFAARPSPRFAVIAAALYGGAFALVRVTGSEAVPGVWPILALMGVVMGVAIAPLLSRTRRIGHGLTWLGRRTLQIYVIHMPVLALVDALVVRRASDGGRAVQLVAAAVLPIILTAVVIAVSVLLGNLIARDRLTWLLDLPASSRTPRPAPSARAVATGRRVPWRTPLAILVCVALGIGATHSTAVPAPSGPPPSSPAQREGEVSIGATGDILLYDVGHRIPDDRGAGHFDQVREWFTQDLVTGNLEQAVSPDTGADKCGQSDKCFAFRSETSDAGAFSPFTILNLANNHSRDYGQPGYDNTKAALASVGTQTVGDRDQIVYSEHGDITVAMIGFAPYGHTNRVTDLRQVQALVRTADEHADVVVVQAHMGAEGPDAGAVTRGTETMYGENRGDPVAFSHAAIDAGADLVLGHGPHVLRGMEWHRGRLIAYSLGNFGGGGVFGKDPATRYGAYLSVRLRADGAVLAGRVESVRFSYDDGIPLPDPDGHAAQLMNQRGQRDFPQTNASIGADGTLELPAPPAE